MECAAQTQHTDAFWGGGSVLGTTEGYGNGFEGKRDMGRGGGGCHLRGVGIALHRGARLERKWNISETC